MIIWTIKRIPQIDKRVYRKLYAHTFHGNLGNSFEVSYQRHNRKWTHLTPKARPIDFMGMI